MRHEATIPPYVCAILQDASSKELLMEVRDETAKRAAGKLALGQIEPSDKTPMAGLLRELQEEIQWNPARTQTGG